MKVTFSALLSSFLFFASAPSFADCLSAQEAYQIGQSVGKETCNHVQLNFANRIVASAAARFAEICDIRAVIACKAGFRDGFFAGRSVSFGGITVPSCRRLYNQNFQLNSGSTRTLYRDSMQGLCNAELR